MLVKIFTIWLMASNITVLSPIDTPIEKGCRIYFSNKNHVIIRDKSCDEVAIKINERVEDVKQR